MVLFDANEKSFIEEQIQENDTTPEFGIVTNVFPRLGGDTVDVDQSFHQVNVSVPGEEKVHRQIQWINRSADEIDLPKVGDPCILSYLGGSNPIRVAESYKPTDTAKPVVGRSGMWRRRIASGESPIGGGDIYIESWTKFDESQAKPGFDRETATVENASLRIGKKDEPWHDPVMGYDIPAMVELFDDPENDKAHLTMEANRIDGDDSLGADITMDLKSGEVTVRGNGESDFGLKLNVKTGEFKILDESGYGIVSDGNGNFDWYYQTIDYKKDQTTSL